MGDPRADRLGVDTENVFLAGTSAGGITVLHAAYLDTEEAPKDLVDAYGRLAGRENIKGVISFAGALYDLAYLGGAGELRYRDANFPGRAGWKEIIATGGEGIVLVESSVAQLDRSQELTDYPTDLLNSPPQDVEALHAAGAAAIFPPGTVIADAAASLIEDLNRRLGYGPKQAAE